MSDDRNLRLSGRPGRANRDLHIIVGDDPPRSPVATRWVIVGLVVFWIVVILTVRACS